MNEWINPALDFVLICLVTAGLVQSMRLIRHLAGLRQGRIDMERFVKEFNVTVMRAEAGIKGLREAARASGDDLEKLVEKASLLRDELHFMVESADQIASRLGHSASTAARPSDSSPPNTPPAPSETVTPFAARKTQETPAGAPSSRAEKELLQALEKLG
jgi:hypothetical protein